MGCDIHLYVEKRNEETGNGEAADKDNWTIVDSEEMGAPLSWVVKDYTGEHTYTGRDYPVFALLTAGTVRLNINPSLEKIAPPLAGLPIDISHEVNTLFKVMDTDAHTPNHMQVDTLAKFITDFKRSHVVGLLGDWQEFDISRLEQVLTGLSIPEKEDLSQWRIVFWFDN